MNKVLVIITLGFAMMFFLAVPVAQASPGKCHRIKNKDARNLCLAKAHGQGAKYCGRIKSRDLHKYCEATVQYKSRAMCGFIKNRALKKKCRAEFKGR